MRLPPRPRCDRNAAWTFWKTVRRGKMLVRWKERPTPSRQRSCGAMPVTSRPSSFTWPRSGRRWPVIRLKSVVLPAPLGPMMAPMLPVGASRLTPPTATKPSKTLTRSRTSSTAHLGAARTTEEPPDDRADRAGDTAGEAEQEHHQDDTEHERPVLRVRDDLLVQEDQDERTDARTEEGAHAPEQGHDQHLGRLRPVREVREHPPVEDPEEPAGQAGERAGQHKGGQLVAPHVDADELRPLGILADRRQHAPEGRPDDPSQAPQAGRDDCQADEIEVLGRPPAPDERDDLADRLEPREIRIRDLRHALLPAGHLVPLEADRPHDLREREREHREVDPRQAHTEEAGGQREQRREQAGSREREQEREP